MSGRELGDEAIRLQAAVFLDYYHRAGMPLLEAFHRWGKSKGFTDADLEAIRSEAFEP